MEFHLLDVFYECTGENWPLKGSQEHAISYLEQIEGVLWIVNEKNELLWYVRGKTLQNGENRGQIYRAANAHGNLPNTCSRNNNNNDNHCRNARNNNTNWSKNKVDRNNNRRHADINGNYDPRNGKLLVDMDLFVSFVRKCLFWIVDWIANVQITQSIGHSIHTCSCFIRSSLFTDRRTIDAQMVAVLVQITAMTAALQVALHRAPNTKPAHRCTISIWLVMIFSWKWLKSIWDVILRTVSVKWQIYHIFIQNKRVFNGLLLFAYVRMLIVHIFIGKQIHRSGLCVSGQSIRDACERIKRYPHPDNMKIIANLGTVDILHGRDLADMYQDYYNLVKVCNTRGIEIVITTLPPIANRLHLRSDVQKLNDFNDFLLKLKNQLVIDIRSCMTCPATGKVLFDCYQGYVPNHFLWF